MEDRRLSVDEIQHLMINTKIEVDIITKRLQELYSRTNYDGKDPERIERLQTILDYNKNIYDKLDKMKEKAGENQCSGS